MEQQLLEYLKKKKEKSSLILNVAMKQICKKLLSI
jgi:hypothetical protein